MARLKIENPAPSPPIADPAAEHLAAGKPADKYCFAGTWNIKIFPVHLLRRKPHTGRDPPGNRMTCTGCPHQFLIVALSPPEGTGGPHQAYKRLRHMGRVKRNKAHSPVHPFCNPLCRLIRHLMLGNVGPIYQHVRMLQHLPGQSLFRIIQQGHLHRISGSLKDFPEPSVNSPGVNLVHVFGAFLPSVFIPYRNLNTHLIPPLFLQSRFLHTSPDVCCRILIESFLILTQYPAFKSHSLVEADFL